MNWIFCFLCLFGMFLSPYTTMAQRFENANDYKIKDVKFNKVKLDDNFWMPRILQNQKVTIPIALKQCWDTGRIDNFKKAAGLIDGYFDTENPFDDSDVFKILEGMAYSIQNIPNKQLEQEMDEIIGYIAAAQEKDGYLYTARTVAEPGKLHPWIHPQRWVNAPGLSHELYNMGHLYEAAVAHYISTGKRTLLDVALKNADLLVKEFLGKQLPYEPGHQIIESGLVKLYRITHNEDYLKLAKYFLDLRGNKGIARSEYSQTHLPVTQQREAVGHAVRAAYMYCGMADVAAITGDKEYVNTISTIWNNVVDKKLYVTGGIGSLHGGEALGANYYLPNLTAYCETCAAIANVYWNWRMFLSNGEAKYYDVIERSLYNGVLSGISLSGDRFFYPNPLESKGGRQRSEWFGCACCPSNLCRFFASVGGYMYAHEDNNVYVNLYAQGTVEIELNEKESVKLRQVTDYPWNGKIQISVEQARKRNKPFCLMLRLPGWAANRPVPSDLYHYENHANAIRVQVFVNGKPVDYVMNNGYMTIERKWKKSDVISFELPMNVHFTLAHDNVIDDDGKTALERGPIVYCVEKIDNPDSYDFLIINPKTSTATPRWTDELNGLNKLVVQAEMADNNRHDIQLTPVTVTAIPYYAWDNRSDLGMKVWLPTNTRTLSGAMGPVELNDTLSFNVVMEPRNDYAPHEEVLLPKERILNFLELTDDEFNGLMGSRVVYAAINPDGGIDIESTATAPGHWFNYNSHVCTWGGGAKIYSELHTDGKLRLHVGQFPKSCKKGDHFLIVQSLTKRATKNYPAKRMVFKINVTIV